MITNTINGITRLTATDGMMLYNGQSSGTEVWLSPQDKMENWYEVDYPESEMPDPNGEPVDEVDALLADMEAAL